MSEVDRTRLERALNPATVVVVGDRAPNFQWLTNMSEFTGTRYSVQVSERAIAGIKAMGIQNFSSLEDVPGDLDLVICAVSRQHAPQVAAQAAARGVGGLVMYTSGFAETGEEFGEQLQGDIVDICRRAGMPLIGPNCMGVYNRRLGLKFNAAQEVGEVGVVSVISQSGAHSTGFAAGCQRLGVPVSRAISIGNAALLSEVDFIEYLAEDDDTRAILMYLEGVRDGRKFVEVLRRASRKKPVIVLRGGRTRAGARAVASHTGALASSDFIWDAVMKQTGAIAVDSVEDAVDTVAAIVHMPCSTADKLALIAMTGGQSVAITDHFEAAGFEVPELSHSSYGRLAEFFVTIGGSYQNPLDASNTIGLEAENLSKIYNILADDAIVDGGVAAELSHRGLDDDLGRLDEPLSVMRAYRERTGRPVMAFLPDGSAVGAAQETLVRARQYVAAAEFPIYPSFQRGAQAWGRALKYWRWREQVRAL